MLEEIIDPAPTVPIYDIARLSFDPRVECYPSNTAEASNKDLSVQER